MTRFYGIDEANAQLPEVREVLTTLRDQRDELVLLRDQALERQAALEAGVPGGGGGSSDPISDGDPDRDPELRRIRLRMQGLVDQMQAGANRLDDRGITLREIGTGLIDFPALVNGRQVWLCWRLGEDAVEWWHELSTGFGGRRRLIDLV